MDIKWNGPVLKLHMLPFGDIKMCNFEYEKMPARIFERATKTCKLWL